MLVAPHEEWQSLHEKLDHLTETVEKNQNVNLGSDWLESEEARKLLGVSAKTWQNYREQRLIPFSQIGRKIYVNRAALDAFLWTHRIPAIKSQTFQRQSVVFYSITDCHLKNSL